LRAFQPLGLQPERRRRTTERRAIGPHADESDRAGPEAADLGGKLLSTGDELGVGELIGRRGGAIDQVGEAIAQAEQLRVLGGMKQARRESRRVQRRPEAVAGAREVKARRGGIEAWVDAAEQDLQAGRDDVAQAPAGRRLKSGLIGRA
jgi:hypothetical protein